MSDCSVYGSCCSDYYAYCDDTGNDSADTADSGQCGQGYVVNCQGGCTLSSWVGDGVCDRVLLCPRFDFDGGDCGDSADTGGYNDTDTDTGGYNDPDTDMCDETMLAEFTGLAANNLGLAAWQAPLGSTTEEEALGHSVDIMGCGSENAYYYLASRDYVDNNSMAGLQVATIPAMLTTQSYLSSFGYNADDITVRLVLHDLGTDMMNYDWYYSGSVEQRYYQGASVYIDLDGVPMLVASDTALEFSTDYSNCGNRHISGMTSYLWFENIANQQQNPVAYAVGEAMKIDFGIYNANPQIIFEDISPATNGGFTNSDREGYYYDVLGTSLVVRECEY
ncbi:MAG: hypothetical protein HN348_35555 [Proteobacteria bacterium]|nr:hypothetical protein [Pseudomonadota bacterium]